jgi:gamma-glutamyltranspeptidase/glutathione hydrolase
LINTNEYAEKGFPVSEIIAAQWRRAEPLLHNNEAAAHTFLVNGKAPKEGDLFVQANLAMTLRAIAKDGRDAFYKGEIAQKIADYVRKNGGLLSCEDLAEHTSEWVQPIFTDYKGYQVYELPPNGQGIVTLEMLNILENFDLASLGHNSSEYLHLLIEAKKLAFADRDRYIADPKFAKVPVQSMLSKDNALQRSRLIQMDRAAEKVEPGLEMEGDTVYFTVVDKERNAISFINSIFHNFGSGIVAGDTGVVLQNRGSLFSLDEQHLNCLEPGKRPFHTIIPAMVMKNDQLLLSFGVMGGDMQPQGQVQVLLNLLEFGMNIQAAGEAPRFRHADGEVALESEIPAQTALELFDKGHKIVSGADVFGGFQGIRIDPHTGLLQGGSDPRKDGCALGY